MLKLHGKIKRLYLVSGSFGNDGFCVFDRSVDIAAEVFAADLIEQAGFLHGTHWLFVHMRQD